MITMNGMYIYNIYNCTYVMIYINIYLFLCVFTFISYECVYTGLNMNMYVPIDKVSFIYAYIYIPIYASAQFS